MVNRKRIKTLLQLLLITVLAGSLVWEYLRGDKGAAAENSSGTSFVRDDEPDLAFDAQGNLWLVFSRFQNADQDIYAKRRKGGVWDEPFCVSDSPEPDFKPKIASDGRGGVWVIWVGRRGQMWNILARHFDGKRWDNVETVAEGREYNPAIALDKSGRLHVVWESHRKGLPDIYWRIRDGKRWAEPKAISDARGAKGNPSIVVGGDGRVWAAWDCAEGRSYHLHLSWLNQNTWQKPMRVPADDASCRLPQLAVDREDRVWIAFEKLRVSPYENTFQPVCYRYDVWYGVMPVAESVLCFDGQRWMRPKDNEGQNIGLFPRPWIDRKDSVWIFTRRSKVAQTLFKGFSLDAQSYTGDKWSEVRDLSGSRVGIKYPAAVAEDGAGNLWLAWQRDDRRWADMVEDVRKDPNYPAWSYLDGGSTIEVEKIKASTADGMEPLLEVVKSREPKADQDNAELLLPQYRTTYQGQELQVYYGDLHEHSEISVCGVGQGNGDIEGIYRYSHYLRHIDFIAVSDHAEHINDHDWYRMRNYAAFYNMPGNFVTFLGYEWTSEFQRGANLHTGHYNTVFSIDDARAKRYSSSDWRSNTPYDLWQLLKRDKLGGVDVFTFPHHPSRLVAPVDWSYYDPEMATLIEVAQVRGSYEYYGSPYPIPKVNDTWQIRGHFVQDGLARGYRYGFIASGDHGGRPLAAVFAKEKTRDAIFRGLKLKMCYGTTGERMFLDVRVDGHFMGEEFVARGPRRIYVRAIGTKPILVVDIWRNGQIAYSQHGQMGRRLELEYVDEEPLLKRENYYYVRVMQEDGHLAWSSPVWVIDESYPPQVTVDLGDRQPTFIFPDRDTKVAVLVRNEKEEPVQLRASLELPSGWQILRTKEEATLAPRSWHQLMFLVRVPKEHVQRLEWVDAKLVYRIGDAAEQRKPIVMVQSPILLSTESIGRIMDIIYENEERDMVNRILDQISRAQDLSRGTPRW